MTLKKKVTEVGKAIEVVSVVRRPMKQHNKIKVYNMRTSEQQSVKKDCMKGKLKNVYSVDCVHDDK